MQAINILVVDDSNEWRRKVRLMLEAAGFRVIGQAGDGFEAIKTAAQLQPDVVLLDIGLPLLNGIKIAPSIRKVSPRSRIIFLTMHDDHDLRTAALATGAGAYVLKAKAAEELRLAINASVCGEQPAYAAATPALDNRLNQPARPLCVSRQLTEVRSYNT